MAITQKVFKPSFLYTYQSGSYRNSNSPVKSAGSSAYTSIIGFPTEAIDAIRESKTSAKIYIKWRVTDAGTVAFGAHKKASNDKQPNIYYTYIGIERSVPTGWYTQEVTTAPLTNGGYTFKTALLSYGYKGLVFYGASGQNYHEGYGITSDSNCMQIIIEGTFDDTPTAPTNLVPSTGRTIDPSANNTFTWRHNGTGLASTQNGYRIAYRQKPSGSWTYIPSSTGFNSSADSRHTFSPSTFSIGEYEWYVVTRSTNNQVSPASSTIPFNVVSIASAPSITSPAVGAILTSDLLTVSWTSVNQTYYTLELLDSGGNVIYTEEKAGSNKTTQIAGKLEDASSYSIRLWIENTDGASSAVSTRSFTTQFVRPEKPIINSVTTTDGTDHIINFSTLARQEYINPNAETMNVDFNGKVAGSLTENPHIARSYNGVLATSTGLGTELTQGQYDAHDFDDSVTTTLMTTTNTQLAQIIYSFDIVAHVEQQYGVIPNASTLASKITWIKANFPSITVTWKGRGSSPTGNNATLRVWSKASNTWVLGTSNTTGSTANLSITVTLSGFTWIDTDGKLYVLANADASNGTVASTLITDYVKFTTAPSPTTYAMVLSYADVYARRYSVDGSNEWFAVEKGITPASGIESINYRFPSGSTMEYKVEVVSSSGSKNTSDIYQFSTTFDFAYLALNSDLSNMIAFAVNESRDEDFVIEQELTQFLGRKHKVPEFGISEDTTLTLDAYFDTYPEVQAVKNLARFRRALYYRDYSGREMVCVISGSIQTKDLIAGGYEVSLTVEQIDSGVVE